MNPTHAQKPKPGRRDGRGGSRASRGFTVIELMIVIAIMSMTVIAMPSFHNWQAVLRTNTAVRAVAADMRLARSLAVDRSLDVYVEFDLANGSYNIYVDADGDGPQSYDLTKSVDLTELGEQTQFGSLSSVSVGGGSLTAYVMLEGAPSPPRIVMKPNGSAIHPGVIYLANGYDIARGRVERCRAVQVLGTGGVSQWRHDGTDPDNPWVGFV
ncbi:GspH/FimT family pseudopilin [bacterium]|nr:GspH/FimT family pseudopilin [bacterium]